MEPLNNLRNTFAERLAHFRELRGWTQHDLAAAMDKESPAAVRGWEQGTRWPQPEEIERAANALGVQANDLLTPPDFKPKPTDTEILARVAAGLEALRKIESLPKEILEALPLHPVELDVIVKSVLGRRPKGT